MEYDTHSTVYVLHDRLLGTDLPPYKLPLEEVRHSRLEGGVRVKGGSLG